VGSRAIPPGRVAVVGGAQGASITLIQPASGSGVFPPKCKNSPKRIHLNAPR